MIKEESMAEVGVEPETDAIFCTIEKIFCTIGKIEETVKLFEATIWESKNLGEESADHCTAVKGLLSRLQDETNNLLEENAKGLEEVSNALKKAQEALKNTSEYIANEKVARACQIRDKELREISETLEGIVRDVPDAEMRGHVRKLADYFAYCNSAKEITRTDLAIVML